MRRFAERPDAGLVYAWSRVIDGEGRIRAAKSAARIEGDAFGALIVLNFVGGGSVPLVRTDMLRRIGGYDERLRALRAEGCEDLKMQLLMAEAGPVAVVPEYLVGYRVSALTYGLVKGLRLVRVPYIAMANLLAGRELAPELVQERCRGELLAPAVLALLDSPRRVAEIRAVYRDIHRRLRRDAGREAAAAILELAEARDA